MSAKNNDAKGRRRSETIAYRCSPEERRELERRWRICGFRTKQDYTLECVLHPYVIAKGNPMMLVSIRKELKEILEELKRINDASEVDEELFVQLRLMIRILESFRDDEANNRRTKK